MKNFIILFCCLCFELQSFAQKSDLEQLTLCKKLFGNVISRFDSCVSGGDIIRSRECFDEFHIVLDIELFNYPMQTQENFKNRAYEYSVFLLISQLRATVSQSEFTDSDHIELARLDLIATIEVSCFEYIE